MATYTNRIGLEKFAGTEKVTVSKINSNSDKADAAVGVLWVNDGVTPPAADLYHGKIVRELTSNKQFVARDDGSGGYILSLPRGKDIDVRYTGNVPLVGPMPGVADKLILQVVNVVVNLTGGDTNVAYAQPFPNAVLAIDLHNGDAFARPGHVVVPNPATALHAVNLKVYSSGNTLAVNGPFRIMGFVLGW